jgi:transposase
MAGERRAGRDRGKSDRIDALAVARAALREGVERLPVAELEGVELDIRLLIDQRLSDELCVRSGRHVGVSLGIGLRSGS